MWQNYTHKKDHILKQDYYYFYKGIMKINELSIHLKKEIFKIYFCLFIV